MKIKAEFRCLKCYFEWQSEPGPTQCSRCGHLYVKWVNYEEMRKYWDYLRENENKE